MDTIDKYIPLDKSWIIRLGVMDWLNGRSQINEFLSKQENLSDDLMALKNVVKIPIECAKEIDVGESGTLYRFVKFACWKKNINPRITVHGTLINRNICNDSSIINLTQEELLKLDNGTSQWASASVLLGDYNRIRGGVPYKLWLTYEAILHWENMIEKGIDWEPIIDKTIKRHAVAILNVINGGKSNFASEHSEDYCMLRAFGLINAEEGKNRWPSLIGHETNRIIEMEKALTVYNDYGTVSSKDHRVIQAIFAYSLSKGKVAIVENADAVNKSWPQFWEFVKFIRRDILNNE